MAKLSRKRLGQAMFASMTLLAVGVSTCFAETILDERLFDDPIAAGRAVVDGDGERFEFNPAALRAHYDTALATSKFFWPLGRTFSQSTDFSFSFDFTLHGDTLEASPDAFAQLSFGLTNSATDLATTGNDRAGGAGGDAFDVVTVDYFPNVSDVFGGPNLGPSVVETDRGGGFFDHLQFPFGAESRLDDSDDNGDERPLPLDVRLRAHVTYAAEDKLLTLRMLGPDGLLPINRIGGRFGEEGGEDGDVTTIELLMPPTVRFSVDSASILLWQDTFAPPGVSTVRADLDFHAIRVFDEIVALTPSSDLTRDGWVDFDDLAALLSRWDEMATARQGNLFDASGTVVNFDDLAVLLTAWTGPGPAPAARLAAGPAAKQVPEPSSVVLAIIALVALVWTAARRGKRDGNSKVVVPILSLFWRVPKGRWRKVVVRT